MAKSGLVVSSLRRLAGNVLRDRLGRWRNREYRRRFGQSGLLRATNPEYLDAAREYWLKHYGKAGDPLWFTAIANVTGVEDVRFVPNDLWFHEILPYFNKMAMRAGYLDKNLSGLLLDNADTPITTVRRIHDNYYDAAYRLISREAALAAILAGGERQVIKPSLTDNGVGITPISISDGLIRTGDSVVGLEGLERSHGGDFIVQSWIRQHPVLAGPHPGSVNTIRMVTFRFDGEIRVLLAFVRFGSGGKLTDNASTGGVCCGVDESGMLADKVVDKEGRVNRYHPTSGYDFANRVRLPDYDRICRRAIELHGRIWHFDLVSWDIALGESGEPLFVEFNVRGTSFTYQFACGRPLFGDLTEAVLERIRDSGGQRSRSDYLQE